MSSSPNQEQITLNLSWKCSLSCYSHPHPPFPFIYLSAVGFFNYVSAARFPSRALYGGALKSHVFFFFLYAIVAELD